MNHTQTKNGLFLAGFGFHFFGVVAFLLVFAQHSFAQADETWLSTPASGGKTLIVDMAFPDANEDTDGDDNYKSIGKAVSVAQCGDVVTVKPGKYLDRLRFEGSPGSSYTHGQLDPLDTTKYTWYSGETWWFVGNKDCTAERPLVIQAENPVVGPWTESERGAGQIQYCNKSGADYNCDYSKVSHFPWISGTAIAGKSNAYITIKGFETHAIGFGSDNNLLQNRTYWGCKNCRIERVFANVNFTTCIMLASSDYSELVGSQLYCCGGDDTGDTTFGLTGSINQAVHHNEIFGSGLPNMAVGFTTKQMSMQTRLTLTEMERLMRQTLLGTGVIRVAPQPTGKTLFWGAGIPFMERMGTRSKMPTPVEQTFITTAFMTCPKGGALTMMAMPRI